MSTIIEQYNELFQELKGINQKILEIEQGIQKMRSDSSISIEARIHHLEETLEKVDEYVLKVKGFQELAKRNLNSMNVLTIEAPPGYRVNLNRLQNWAMMIDPQSDNDPFAQRVYAVSKCDECFLEQKRREFQERIEVLRNDQSSGFGDEVAALEMKRQSLMAELDEIADGDRIKDFANALNDDFENRSFKDAPESFRNKTEDANTELLVGEIGYPFFSGEKSNNKL